MMANARRSLRRMKVAPGGLEEFQHRLVFKGGRIGEVDHHLCAGQSLSEPCARDGIDAALGRGCHRLVTAFAQKGDSLRANQAGSADYDDFHSLPPHVDDWRTLNRNVRNDISTLTGDRTKSLPPQRS